ncbi:MAG: hypothetical protein JW765_04320 [Deltaproteobacteria bacterium]|nr:hypothetical protein [Candidatus Zymogenaceae bacterium]
MKRLFIFGIPALVCLCLLLPAPVFSGGCFSYYCAFDTEVAAVTKNGEDTDGRVFTKTYDPEPDELLVMAGDAAFMVKMRGAFMQSFGMTNIYDVTIHSMDNNAEPVTIDYEVGYPVAGAVLEETGDGAYAFTAGGDRYEVRLKNPIERDPEMFASLRGILLSKTERKGSKSEGPEYYLKPDDGQEIHVVKNVSLWEEDPDLQEMVGSEVWVFGTLVDGELVYKVVNFNER